MAEWQEQGAGIQFQVSTDGVKLLAVFEPPGSQDSIDEAWVRQNLATEGFADLYTFDYAITELITKYSNTSQPFSLQIGERRNGTVTLTVADNFMSAQITTTLPFGGQPVTAEQIYQVLTENKIVSGIMHEEIEAVVRAGKVENCLIAEGRLAQPGDDTQFLSLVPEMEERRSHEDDNDIVDYRDRGDIVSVKLGAPLMRRIPPTEGEAGESIFGVSLPPTPGCDVPFAADLKGTACDPDDPDLLVAAYSGLPVLVPNGIIVEPLICVKKVDLSTGNLHFEGNLSIAGDVDAGMDVRASGDIEIGGIVEAAKVHSGGNIVVKGGVIGHIEGVRTGTGTLAQGVAHLHAEGSISVQFVENASVIAGGNIIVQELAMQSELTAGGKIVVGETGGRKGHIIGGMCRATTLVHTIVAGSHASVITKIEVGVDPSVKEKLDNVNVQLVDKEKRLEETVKTLEYLKEHADSTESGMLKLKERVHGVLQTEITELLGQKKRLQKKLELIGNAKVVVEREVFAGVHVMIGDKSLHVEEDQGQTTFVHGENGVVSE